MFSDYKEKVLGEYQKKRAESTLSINLLHPTPGKLKAECLIVYMERYLQKDDQTLRLFFGSKDQTSDYGQSIRNFENDKFKPLINFLNRRTSDTEDKNIALLAWLINFEPRPYKFGNTYDQNPPELPVAQVANPVNIKENKNAQSITEVKPTPGEHELVEEKQGSHTTEKLNEQLDSTQINRTIQQVPKDKTPSWTKNLTLKRVLSLTGIVIALGCAFLFIIPDEKCMQWTGDHYERLSCNQKTGDFPIIALDTEKVAHLKRIRLPDTITKNGIGKIWYARIDGELEFYTADGEHPVYSDRRLKPLTNYILDKYLIDKK